VEYAQNQEKFADLERQQLHCLAEAADAARHAHRQRHEPKLSRQKPTTSSRLTASAKASLPPNPSIRKAHPQRARARTTTAGKPGADGEMDEPGEEDAHGWLPVA
jgi:hypothetical protein